jgi:diacylglycerol kinase family enzyme
MSQFQAFATHPTLSPTTDGASAALTAVAAAQGNGVTPPHSGPLYVVHNAGSGSHEGVDNEQIMSRVFAEAGRSVEFLRIEDPRQIDQLARRAVALAFAHQGIVVAAGGDGTINAVAGAVLAGADQGQLCAFGVLPQGTFNYFGRAHGIPQDTEAAARALVGASVAPVQVGLVNGQLFLVNASVGLYPQLLEDREAWKQRLGRSRLVAFFSGVVTLFSAWQQLRLQIESHTPAGVACDRQLRTPTLFVGNNQLQLTRVGIDPSHAGVVAQGQLAAVVVRPIGTASLFWLMLRGIIGRLGEADNINSFTFERLTVKPTGRKRIKVATDGETHWLATPLRFEVSAQPLMLMVPSAADRVAVE